MAGSIRRITAIESTANGTRAVEIYSVEKKRRKVSRKLRPLERRHRRLLEAHNTFTSELLDRHERSNRKRKNGAYRNMFENLSRAHRKAHKRLRKN